MTCVARTTRLSGLALAPPGQASVRRLMWATLITSFGNGAWYTCWALFLTRTVGLSPARVGIGITIAGAIGLLASAPLGMLADRLGTAAVLVPLSLLQAAGFVAYLAVRDFWAFLPVACATVATDRGAIGLRSALALRVSGSREALQTLAIVRVAASGGFALGSALGAVAIAFDSRAARPAVPDPGRDRRRARALLGNAVERAAPLGGPPHAGAAVDLGGDRPVQRPDDRRAPDPRHARRRIAASRCPHGALGGRRARALLFPVRAQPGPRRRRGGARPARRGDRSRRR